MKATWLNISVGIISALALLIIFIFQSTDVAGFLNIHREPFNFITNRSIRFILNDFFAIGLIFSLFPNRKYVVFALWVQLAGVAFILLPYFAIKFFFISYNGPLISFLHRLVMNPILILLLIPAFYYQRKTSQEHSD